MAAAALVMTALGAILALAVWAHLSHRTAEDLRLNLADFMDDYASANGDLARMKENFLYEKGDFGDRNLFAVIYDTGGSALVDTGNDARVLTKMRDHIRAGERRFRISVRMDGDSERIVVQVMSARLPDGRLLSVGRNTTDDEKFMLYFCVVLVVVVLISFIPICLLADRLARRLKESLHAVSETAGLIQSGRWSARVPPSDTVLDVQVLGDAFNAMAERNESTIRELRTLTDDIAHDLRTPLTRMLAASELAAMGGTLKHPLPEFVLEQSSAMLEMINAMLALSRTDYEMDHTPRETIDLAKFVHDFADLYATVMDDGGLKLSVSVPDSPVLFSGHRGKLQQLLGNLLDNAIKFSSHGGNIAVRVDESEDAIHLVVSDTGCGIGDEDIPYIFNRFWRADSSRTLPGNGLGLALVKAIVTSYGGQVTCRSAPGKGSTFEVCLPRTS